MVIIQYLDSGFRRNDASRQAISWFVLPTKVGAFRRVPPRSAIQVFLMIVLSSYIFWLNMRSGLFSFSENPNGIPSPSPGLRQLPWDKVQ